MKSTFCLETAEHYRVIASVIMYYESRVPHSHITNTGGKVKNADMRNLWRAGEMVQLLRALAVLPEGPGSMTSTHTKALKHLSLNFQVDPMPSSCPVLIPHTYVRTYEHIK